MATRRKASSDGSDSTAKRGRPATTPEARENQLIAKAFSLAERQLEDGTASSQVITHYLKLGSSREQLEQKRLEGEIALGVAKIETMQSVHRIEEMYKDAMIAMSQYGGREPLQLEVDYDDD